MTEPDSTAPAPDALAVVQRDLSDAHADLQQVQSAVLREGPRSKKTARYVAVRNRHTGEVHHHALTLETGKKLKGSWELDDKRSISFSDEDGDEIARLMDFLRLVRGEAASAGDTDPIEAIATLAGDVDGLKRLVRRVRERPDAFRAIAAAITFGRYAQALERLKKLLAEEAEPDAMRALVAEHPWLVGCEHGEPVPAIELDGAALLHRVPSGALEATVVGPASGVAGRFDGPAPGLSGWLAEALRVHDLLAPAGPVGLTLLVGRDGDETDRAGLARLNAHLRGIEVVTYDEVARRAQKLVEALRRTARGEPG